MIATTYQMEETTLVDVHAARIDAGVAGTLRTVLREAIATGARRVVVHLGAVVFMDSSGLGALVCAHRDRAPEQVLRLAALTPAVRDLFQLTRMDYVMPVYENIGEAILDA